MPLTTEKLTEPVITQCVKEFLISKPDGNWHQEKVKESALHGSGPDLVLVGGKGNGEHFIIECKGKSYSASARSINKEGWLYALGQLITQMKTERVIQTGVNKGKINRAYKYGLGLYWVGAQVALRRIPHFVSSAATGGRIQIRCRRPEPAFPAIPYIDARDTGRQTPVMPMGEQ